MIKKILLSFILVFSLFSIFSFNNSNSINAATVEKSAKITDYNIGYFSGFFNGQVVVFNAPAEIDDISNIDSIHIEYTTCDTQLLLWCLNDSAIKEKTFTIDSVIGEYETGFSWLQVTFQPESFPETIYYDVPSMGNVSFISRTEFTDTTNDPAYSFSFEGSDSLIAENYSYYFIMDELLNPYIKVITINYTSTTGDVVIWDVDTVINDTPTLNDALASILEFINTIPELLNMAKNFVTNYWYYILLGFLALGLAIMLLKKLAWLVIKGIFTVIYQILKWTIFLPITLISLGTSKVKEQKEFTKKLDSYYKNKEVYKKKRNNGKRSN